MKMTAESTFNILQFKQSFALSFSTVQQISRIYPSNSIINMQSIVFAALLAVASAASVQYVQYPQYSGLNSAVVTSQRLGGNFAYTVQQPGYAGVVSPYTVSPYTVAQQVVAAPTVAKTPVTYTVQGNKLVAGVNPITYTTAGAVVPQTYTNTLGYNALPYNTLGYPYNTGYTGYPYTQYNGLYNGYNNVVVA